MMNLFVEKIKNCINVDRKIVMILLILECFIKNTPLISFGNYSIYIVCIVSIIVLFKRLVFNREIYFRKQNIYGYIFVLSIIITAIVNNAIFNYNNLVLLIISIIMFFIVMVFDYKELKVDVLNEFAFVASITVVLHFVYSISSIIYSFSLHDIEIKGLLGYSYFYSYNCVTIVGLSLFLFFYKNDNIIKYFYLFNLLLHLVIIFFTCARASYLGVFVSLLFIIYILAKNKSKKINYKLLIKYIVIFVLAAIISIFVISFITKFSIIKVLTKVFSTHNILSWRDIIWEASALALLNGNILLGSSVGLLPKFLSNYIDNVYVKNITFEVYDKNAYDSALGIAKAGYLHNIFIQQLCSYGIFGLLTMLMFIFDSVKKYVCIINSNSKNRNVMLAMMCFAFTFIAQIVISFFDDNLFYNIVYICNVFFFYSIGIIGYLTNGLAKSNT